MKIYFASPTGSRKFLIRNAMHTPDTICNLSFFDGNALDNGAFKAYSYGLKADFSKFLKRLNVAKYNNFFFDFCVVPDIVAGGNESLVFSNSYIDNLNKQYFGQKFYLVVQDGMSESEVLKSISKYSGIFVGGTLPWKLRTSKDWIQLAHNHNKLCHIGRVGTVKRVLWAKSISADSVDSGLSMIHPHHLHGLLNIEKSLLWGAL